MVLLNDGLLFPAPDPGPDVPGVNPWKVLFALFSGVEGMPRPAAFFLATEALHESSSLAGRGLVFNCLASLLNLNVLTVSVTSFSLGLIQANMLTKQ